jgi:hypothetical protein
LVEKNEAQETAKKEVEVSSRLFRIFNWGCVRPSNEHLSNKIYTLPLQWENIPEIRIHYDF